MATILLVDSELKDLEQMKKILNNFGHDVIARAEGFSALTVIRNRTPVDAVITECRLPDMEGLRFIEILKKHSPDMPVVVMTGHGSVEGYLQYAEKGAYEFLFKPVHEELIGHIVKTALKSAAAGHDSHALEREVS